MGVELGQIDKREFTLGAIDNKQINIGSGSIIRLPLELPSLEKTVVPTKETQVVNKESGYELTKVTVEPIPDNFIEPTGVFEIEENGEYDITEYKTLVSNVPAREDLDAELNEQDALLNELNSKIDELPDREADLSEATATADDVFEGKVAFGQEGKIVGTYIDMMQRKVDWSKNCDYLFQNCPDEDMTWVNKLNTDGVTRFSYMFQSCKNATLIDISSYNSDAVTSMDNMFKNCSKLKNIIGLSKLKGHNVININSLLESCCELEGSVDLSNLKPNSITGMSRVCRDCNKVKTINLEGINTNNVKNCELLFNKCYELETVLGTIDLLNATSVYSILDQCKAIKNITFKNIKISLQIGRGTSWGHLLTNETLINTIKELWDLTDSTSQTLTISTPSKTNIANIYVKLIEATDEMRAEDPYIDNKKPCVVCESTDEGAMTLTEYAISKGWSIA